MFFRIFQCFSGVLRFLQVSLRVFMGCQGFLLKFVWNSKQLNTTWHKSMKLDTTWQLGATWYNMRQLDSTWGNLIQHEATWYNLTQEDTTQLTKLCTNFVLVDIYVIYYHHYMTYLIFMSYIIYDKWHMTKMPYDNMGVKFALVTQQCIPELQSCQKFILLS